MSEQCSKCRRAVERPGVTLCRQHAERNRAGARAQRERCRLGVVATPAPVSSVVVRSRTLAEAVERLGGYTWPELVAMELQRQEDERHG